jgi:hypothetical protein
LFPPSGALPLPSATGRSGSQIWALQLQKLCSVRACWPGELGRGCRTDRGEHLRVIDYGAGTFWHGILTVPGTGGETWPTWWGKSRCAGLIQERTGEHVTHPDPSRNESEAGVIFRSFQVDIPPIGRFTHAATVTQAYWDGGHLWNSFRLPCLLQTTKDGVLTGRECPPWQRQASPPDDPRHPPQPVRLRRGSARLSLVKLNSPEFLMAGYTP